MSLFLPRLRREITILEGKLAKLREVLAIYEQNPPPPTNVKRRPQSAKRSAAIELAEGLSPPSHMRPKVTMPATGWPGEASTSGPHR